MARIAGNEQIMPVEDTGVVAFSPKKRRVGKKATYAVVRSATVIRENCSDPAALKGA